MDRSLKNLNVVVVVANLYNFFFFETQKKIFWKMCWFAFFFIQLQKMGAESFKLQKRCKSVHKKVVHTTLLAHMIALCVKQTTFVNQISNSTGKKTPNNNFCHESDMAGLNTPRQVADLKDFQWIMTLSQSYRHLWYFYGTFVIFDLL